MEFNKEGLFMYLAAAAVILFVVIEALFFIVKAWKRGTQLGISKQTLRNTVVSSALFTVGPAISILVTVLALSKALGIVLPWVRLSVIGNLAYESTAAEAALSSFGLSLNAEVTDPTAFATVAWCMMIGNMCALTLVTVLCKGLQKKIGNVANKSEGSKKLADMISAAAFIGIIAAFVARAINGTTEDGTGNAGFMSIAVLITSVVIMTLLDLLCRKKNLDKLANFTMPIAMFAAMGMAVLLSAVLPQDIVNYVWR
ncbi:MAG: DUF5058 family protein [Clostridia bacterium]|nr:DUF5058 family protein [Clostridia bacterium]